MKQLILTVDYELFFGSDAGTVENCMIRPTRRLAEVLGEYNCRMTVFWDILHFYRLRQLEEEVKDLKIDRELIEKQIRWLVRQGHDVQMHIHPHWLDSQWVNKKWRFNHTRFSLHRLWDEADPNNIETILGCITQSRLLMEEICRKEDPEYQVRVFRAGGYRVEPFERLADALRANGIKVDSTASFGMKSHSVDFPFDYTRMPVFLHYRFDRSTLTHSQEGEFWEFPKESVKVPWYGRILFYFLRNFFYTEKGHFGDGKRLSFTKKEQTGHMWTRLGSRYYLLTPEEKDPIRWRYLVAHARENALAVLHTKNMSPFTIQMLHQFLENRHLRFRSLLERINELNIYPDVMLPNNE